MNYLIPYIDQTYITDYIVPVAGTITIDLSNATSTLSL